MNGSIYFVSDTHFKYHNIGGVERDKRNIFFRFLRDIRGADKLFLVGDIFDFWFEYRYTIPGQYWDVCYNLQLLRESGTGIYITGGNHDFWLGPFITDIMKFKVLPQLSSHELQGRKVVLTHGDMLLPGDRGYKLLKKIIRSRAVIKLAEMVHPDILFSFARIFSSTSKDFTGRQTEYWADRITGMAENSFFRWDNDTFIMGHVHKPVFRRFGSRVFSILGDWENHFSYLLLRDGRFSPGSYIEDGNTFMENR